MRTPAIAVMLVAAGLAAGCANTGPAPVVDRPATTSAPSAPVPRAQATPTPGAPSAATPSGTSQTYVVKRGDTLYSIALDNGLDYRELALWNRLEDPSRIQVGQTLRLTPPEDRSAVQVGSSRAPGSIDSRPLESRPVEAAKPPASDAALKTEPRAQRLPYNQQNAAAAAGNSPPPASQPQPAAKPAPTKPEPTQSADTDGAEAIDFVWPARGRVIGEFAEPRNKGIDIAGRPGDPVVAAAAGRVTYTGTGIPGMGKLIVIRHDNNYLTIYAHNREVLVKEQQTVVRGQRIAELGSTDSDTPKLHFEIRRGARPLDPRKFLPANP